HHLCITSAAIGFRVILLITETDSNRFPSGWSDERNFVLEALLFAKQGKDFLLQRLGKVSNAIDFQTHGNVSSNHGNLLSGSVKVCVQITCLGSDNLKSECLFSSR